MSKLTGVRKHLLHVTKASPPTTAAGLTADDVLKLAWTGKLEKLKAGYKEPTADPSRACARCRFFAREPWEESTMHCIVVRKGIEWFGTCDQFIDMGQAVEYAYASGEMVLKGAPKPEGTKTTKAESAGTARVVGVWKREMERLVYGVVMEPDVEDAHGDVMSAEDIEKACHLWQRTAGIVKDQHDQDIEAAVVENYILPVDFKADSGQEIKKGSWIQVTKVFDDVVWKMVLDGERTGYSFGGYGVRFDLNQEGGTK